MMRKLSKDSAKTKKVGSLLALLSFTAYMPVSCMQAFAADMVGANTLPSLNKAANGSTSVTGNRMDVSVNGGKGTVAQFDWNTFNVGRNAQVNWVFNANNQTALNRVLASGGMSYIYGKLTESSGKGCPACVNTSKVILINPSGILFGNGSSVNLNSFTTSTFDVKGAKDLKDLSDSQLKSYAGAITEASGENGTLFNIAGYNKTVEFLANENMVNGNGYLTADATGTRLSSIVADGSDIYANKTVAMVGNKIDIKNNTKVTTTYTSASPNASNGTQTRSNVKLVTGDGVNFYYTSNGNIDGESKFNAATKKSTENKGISIADSEIKTGDFLAYNGMENNASINISNSKINTKKLIGTKTDKYTAEQTGTSGNLVINSKSTASIADSDIQTLNDSVNGTTSNGVQYGNLTISGNKGVAVSNSKLKTADATGNTGSAGKIQILSQNGNVDISKGTNASSAGDMLIASGKDVNIDSSTLKAAGDKNEARVLEVYGNNIKANASTLSANNIYKYADAINATKSNIVAGNNLELVAKNTTIDDSLVQYKNLKLYDDTTVNNVTLKNGTTMNDKSSDGLTVVTNGDLTIVDSTLSKKEYGSSTVGAQKFYNLQSTKNNVNLRGANLNTNDGDITVTAEKDLNVKGGDIIIATGYLPYYDGSSLSSKSGNIKLTSKSGNANITDESTISTTTGNANIYANKGNVTADTNSRILAKNINITANNDVAVKGSKVWAKDGNVNVNAKNGKVTAKGYTQNAMAPELQGSVEREASIVAEGGSVTIAQAKDVDLNNDFEKSLVGGTEKLTIKTNGNVYGYNLINSKENIGSYKDVPTLSNTSKNARFTLSKNADIQAGKNISLTSPTKTDLTLTDLTVKAGDDGITSISAGTPVYGQGGNLNLYGKTKINGGKTTNFTGAQIKTPGSNDIIAANGNKVTMSASGDIDVNVSGITNPEKGLEVNAEVNTGVANNNKYGQDALKGRNVKINAGGETLAVSKIKADTLTLKAKDITRGKTTVTNDYDNLGYVKEDGTLKQTINVDKTNAERGYIEVRTDGGFNLDPTTTYSDSNKNIYTGANVGTTKATKTENDGAQYSKVTNTDVKKDVSNASEKISSTTTKNKEIGREEASRKKVGDERVVDTKTKNEPIYDSNGEVIGNRYITTDTVEQDYEVTDNVKYSTLVTDTYKDTQTTKTTTTTETTTYQDYKTTTDTRDRQHVATLKDSEKDAFVIVYGKNTQDVKKGTNVVDKKSDTKVDTKTVVTNEARKVVTDGDPIIEKEKRTITVTDERIKTNDVPCEPEDELIPDLGGNDISSWVRNPRKSEGISDNAPIQNDLADTSSAVVAAAARLQLDEDEENEEDEYED